MAEQETNGRRKHKIRKMEERMEGSVQHTSVEMEGDAEGILFGASRSPDPC